MEKLNQIISLCKCEVILRANPHKATYESVMDYISDRERIEDVDPEVFAAMIEKDFIVELQFYPRTPIGFYTVFHYDLNVALDEALKILEEVASGG